jgi:DNA-binding transcriptional MerR regulator
LCLRCIRRLRALGLSLERIRVILSDATDDAESTPRGFLQSLVEELSAQILELEERRSFLQEFLAADRLESEDREAHFLLSPSLKMQPASHLAGLSAESLDWGHRIDALLGSFHWPAEYRQNFQAAIQHIADQAMRYRHLFSLEERFASLAHLQADDPEVARLAEDSAGSPELPFLREQLARFRDWEKGPLSATFMELLSTAISPAQRRFFELLICYSSYNRSVGK